MPCARCGCVSWGRRRRRLGTRRSPRTCTRCGAGCGGGLRIDVGGVGHRQRRSGGPLGGSVPGEPTAGANGLPTAPHARGSRRVVVSVWRSVLTMTGLPATGAGLSKLNVTGWRSVLLMAGLPGLRGEVVRRRATVAIRSGHDGVASDWRGLSKLNVIGWRSVLVTAGCRGVRGEVVRLQCTCGDPFWS